MTFTTSTCTCSHTKKGKGGTGRGKGGWVGCTSTNHPETRRKLPTLLRGVRPNRQLSQQSARCESHVHACLLVERANYSALNKNVVRQKVLSKSAFSKIISPKQENEGKGGFRVTVSKCTLAHRQRLQTSENKHNTFGQRLGMRSYLRCALLLVNLPALRGSYN